MNGPLDIAEIEAWRRQHPPTGRTTPADWFVWSTNPARHPFLTRLGGVPHREADLPWPVDDNGLPLVFVGQICFLDSFDIVEHKLPGDVLLIFGDTGNGLGSFDPDGFHLEWSQRFLRDPLRREQVPPQAERIPELTGVIHRTVEDWGEVKQGTKIGATTLVIQGSGDEEITCALSCFLPRWRWSTLEYEQLDKRAAATLGELALGDAGCIYVQRLEDGSLWSWQDCY